MSENMNRRTFIETTAAAAAFTIVPGHVLGRNAVPPSDKITFAHIGMGTQSIRELEGLLAEPRIQIVAVADPNKESNNYVEWGKNEIRNRIQQLLDMPEWHANVDGCPGGRDIGKEIIDTYYANQRAQDNFKAVTTYADYRELLDKEQDIDAVKIMTPDHHHAVASIAAMQKGKHVLMHKPIANRMYEGRKVLEVAKQTNVATHLLAYGSGARNGQIVEEVKKGVIGSLREIHNWTNRPVWPQYEQIPVDTPPIPDGFDWDLWLGPALYRPYHPHYTHTVFRGWYDFGGGSMADMGIYSLWPVLAGLQLPSAHSAKAYATHACTIVDNVSREIENDFSYPTGCMIRFGFAPAEFTPELELFWYDGGMKPRLGKDVESYNVEMEREGILFVGDEGAIFADFRGSNARLLKNGENKPLWPEAESERGGRGRRENPWLNAFLGGEPSPGDFLNAASITDTVNLGTVALRAGKKVEFDSKALKITNDEDANKYLYREYRDGWKV